MQIVGDTCSDMFAEQKAGLDITLVPLTFTLDGKTYRDGVDVDSEGFYRMISATTSFPTTSQPSVGDFVEAYKRVAANDSQIMSIQISSALSGTYASAAAAVEHVPEAKITVYDTKTVSGPEGWLVEAAARCAKAGWDAPRIIALLDKIQPQQEFIFTVPGLRYLIHGGRISHLKGLLATALGIKPLIGVEHEHGSLTQEGQARTMKSALHALVTFMNKKQAPGSTLRAQVLHGDNPEGAEQLKAFIAAQYDCVWMPTGPIAPVLGAHTGPGLIGAFFAPLSAYDDVPGFPWKKTT
jgi:DegV family protein with EDD domain